MKFPFALPNKPIILASSSPRRAELLKKIGLAFRVHPSAVAEDDLLNLAPVAMVKALAERKALSVAQQYEHALVIGADTTVVLTEKILGKPESPAAAREMLALLSGKTHVVYTGFTLVDRPSRRTITQVEKTEVTFRELEAEEIAAYVNTGAAQDKAGAYGIQDFSAVFTERINGCFYNVVGFPLTRFYLALREFLA
ncbi:MAG: Maf family protein [candidate division KSB1 bacterium]